MNTKYLLTAALLATGLLSGCTVQNKVLVANRFMGENKTSKFLLLDTGQVNQATKRKLYNVMVRLCDLDAQGAESNCKDTAVLENVIPGSVY
jgi:ribosomal protein S8E